MHDMKYNSAHAQMAWSQQFSIQTPTAHQVSLRFRNNNTLAQATNTLLAQATNTLLIPAKCHRMRTQYDDVVENPAQTKYCSTDSSKLGWRFCKQLFAKSILRNVSTNSSLECLQT